LSIKRRKKNRFLFWRSRLKKRDPIGTGVESIAFNRLRPECSPFEKSVPAGTRFERRSEDIRHTRSIHQVWLGGTLLDRNALAEEIR